jgi:predicted SprT family Zn-dependent metalloprotease
MEDIFRDKRPLKDIIIHEIWLETRIPKIIIEEIIMSQFKFLKHKAMPEYKTVWLQYLGTFGIRGKRLLHFPVADKTMKYVCDCGWHGVRLQHDKENGAQCPVCKTKMEEKEDGIHPKT